MNTFSTGNSYPHHTRKNQTTHMIKSLHVQTLAVLGGIVDFNLFSLLYPARIKSRGDVGSHQIRQLLVAYPCSVDLLCRRMGACLAMALPVAAYQENPYSNDIPNFMHWLYGK